MRCIKIGEMFQYDIHLKKKFHICVTDNNIILIIHFKQVYAARR